VVGNSIAVDGGIVYANLQPAGGGGVRAIIPSAHRL
jgi:hypothetical protein